MNKVSGLEAVHRDYATKKVRVYFVYKALAHPERDGILQPITLEERLTHARIAAKRLGHTVPYLIDAMDNRLKRALGDRNNSEFIIDPKGRSSASGHGATQGRSARIWKRSSARWTSRPIPTPSC